MICDKCGHVLSRFLEKSIYQPKLDLHQQLLISLIGGQGNSIFYVHEV